MTGLIIGMAIGFPCGYSLHKLYIRKMWDAEKALRQRAKGRR